MFAEYPQNPTVETTVARKRFAVPTAVALFIGLGMGALFTWLLPNLPTLATLAPWLLGLALSLVGMILVHARQQGEVLWGMAIGGQALGIVAIGLFFLGSIVR